MDIKKIERMEEILDEHRNSIEELSESLERFVEGQKRYHELREYYFSEEYMNDFDESNSPDFISEVKCGVLSEDAVFDLIGDNYNVAIRMLEAATEIIKNH